GRRVGAELERENDALEHACTLTTAPESEPREVAARSVNDGEFGHRGHRERREALRALCVLRGENRNRRQAMGFDELDRRCVNAIRGLAIDTVEKANSGHPGLPLDAAPMAY